MAAASRLLAGVGACAGATNARGRGTAGQRDKGGKHLPLLDFCCPGSCPSSPNLRGADGSATSKSSAVPSASCSLRCSSFDEGDRGAAPATPHVRDAHVLARREAVVAAATAVAPDVVNAQFWRMRPLLRPSVTKSSVFGQCRKHTSCLGFTRRVLIRTRCPETLGAILCRLVKPSPRPGGALLWVKPWA